MFRRVWVTLATVLTAVAAGVVGGAGVAPAGAAAAEQTMYPVVFSGVAALAYAQTHPDTDPVGANDWSCRPSAAHPEPVILAHGTIENMTYNWFTLAPLLHNAGYCVFALNYGQEPGVHIGLPGAAEPGGVGPIADSAGQFAGFVDRVLAATGAAKVDIIGHSQGGMMPRYYLKFLGGAGKVDNLVGLAPSNHGTTVFGLSRLPGVPQLLTAGLGPSVADQMAGSPFLQRLNAGGDTVPGVRYTVIESEYDDVVTPYTSAFLTGPDVTDIDLQHQCPLDVSDHLAISFDANALRDVLNALDPPRAHQPSCQLTLPIDGG